MTLLSIREQAGGKLAAAKLLVEALSYEHKDEKALDAAWADLRKTVILATRDAIARQVREQADAVFAKHQASCVASGMVQAATFIEGLPCE